MMILGFSIGYHYLVLRCRNPFVLFSHGIGEIKVKVIITP